MLLNLVAVIVPLTAVSANPTNCQSGAFYYSGQDSINYLWLGIEANINAPSVSIPYPATDHWLSYINSVPQGHPGYWLQGGTMVGTIGNSQVYTQTGNGGRDSDAYTEDTDTLGYYPYAYTNLPFTTNETEFFTQFDSQSQNSNGAELWYQFIKYRGTLIQIGTARFPWYSGSPPLAFLGADDPEAYDSSSTCLTFGTAKQGYKSDGTTWSLASTINVSPDSRSWQQWTSGDSTHAYVDSAPANASGLSHYQHKTIQSQYVVQEDYAQ
jgi:hypothetical protein